MKKLLGDKRRGTFVLHSDGPGTSRLFRDSVITFLFFFFKLFVPLFLAALGFCCFPLVCDEQGLLLVAAHGLSYPEA